MKNKKQKNFILQTYSFKARQKLKTEQADKTQFFTDPYTCADKLMANGDLIVAFCKADKKLRFFDSSDLGLIETLDISYGGFWSEIGDRGFELIQVGNGYTIFFGAYQTGSDDQCPKSVFSPQTTIVVNVSNFTRVVINDCILWICSLEDLLMDRHAMKPVKASTSWTW